MHSKKRRPKNASAMKLVGALVARFREAAGLTQRELAERVRLHVETISSIEVGRRALKPDLARLMDRILDTKGALETAVDNLPEVDLYPTRMEQFIDLEREAIAISWYENQVLPGLLQTENYARAVFRCRVPAYNDEVLSERLAERLARQDILRRKVPPAISFIISETVVRDRIGGDEVYAETLRHLRSCADLPFITLQILPLGLCAHAGLNGPFIILETPDDHHVAYAETQRGIQLVAEPDKVGALTRKYAMLRTQALNLEQTKNLLDQLLGEQ
ncbi:helix-turn-helix transcriptional regulator [Streptomyces sp. HNM0663]|uniref:Helix-turn-helix transcriptional regulator n=1 Tax=Streptomyces chengmaiensis TaxID=3040919 RepID=A0ABT6HXL1_9ACTN|nr:helix-turn-helix transcriptional regulator [Streptomyces chengmaiensis]MDH2393441.1 helix-turn-helix transcriptional regulator [Streptomyces chengmaiensis]